MPEQNDHLPVQIFESREGHTLFCGSPVRLTGFYNTGRVLIKEDGPQTIADAVVQDIKKKGFSAQGYLAHVSSDPELPGIAIIHYQPVDYSVGKPELDRLM